MKNKMKKAATTQIGESVQTDAAPAQSQPTTAPDGTTTGNAPVVAGAEAIATTSQSIAVAETQVTPEGGTVASATVPNSPSLAPETPLELLPLDSALSALGVKPKIADMTEDELFTCYKQSVELGYGLRKVTLAVYDEIIERYKTYKKDRPVDCPTVEEAFRRRGLVYGTIRSQISREKTRREEDAKFFAAVKAQASTGNIHGLDVTDNDLPVGTKVILGDGTKGQVLTAGEKTAPDAEPSYEVVTEEGTSVQVKRGDLITLAEKEAAKAAAKAAKDAAKNTPEAQKKAEEKETARVVAAAAKEDAALKSAEFYKEQYFQLLSLINAAPRRKPSRASSVLHDPQESPDCPPSRLFAR
jgi:hypothetical protein